jgi:MFS transporter, AAHS family, 4-hydroxybenzoate transporter
MRYIATSLGIVILMVDGYDLQSAGFVAPEIAQSWNLEIAAFGPVFSAGLAGTIPGAILAGPAARALGHRLALMAALLVFGVGTLLCARVTTLNTLLGLRFVVGLGLGAAIPLVVTLVAENTPARLRATLITITLCGQPLGAILGAALCARLVPVFGWQAAFMLGGIAPLLLLPAVLAFKEDNSPFTHTSSAASGQTSELFHRPLLTTTLLLWSSALLAAIVVHIIVAWMPSIVRQEGYSLKASMLAIGLFNCGGVAGAVVLGALVDRFGPLRIVPPTFVLAGVFVGILALSRDSMPLFLSAALLSGFAAYGGAMSFGPLALLLYPKALRTTGVGWVLGVGRSGAAISPLGASAALSAGLAIGSLFYLAATAAICGALCLFALANVRTPSSLFYERGS